MKSKRILHLLFAVFLMNAFTCGAADETITIEFSVYPIGDTNWDNVYYQRRAQEFVKIDFISYERSKTYFYEGASLICFFEKETSAEKPESFKPIASLSIKETDRKLLLFFQANESDSARSFRVLPIDDNLKSFPLHTLTFVNATGRQVFGTLNGQKLLLETTSQLQIPLHGHFQNETSIQLYAIWKNTPVKVLHNNWKFYPDYREIILLLPSTSDQLGRLRAYRISQHRDELRK